MKIKVSDIEANPYRGMDKYPIDRAKVDAFKNSIHEKGFWENFIVRPYPAKKGKYQIAYGHHRLVALKELRVKEVDNIPCHNLTDDQMMQIMAEENLNWETSPTIINLTVQQAKEYLDKKVKENNYGALEESFRCLFDSEWDFKNIKGKGVGRKTITKFLGKNWEVKEWFVQAALATLKAEKEGTLDRAALETIPHIDPANAFRNEVTKHRIPKSQQKKIAREIVKEKIGSKHIPDLVAEHSTLPPLERKKSKAQKPVPMLDDFVKETIVAMHDVYLKLCRIKNHLDNIQSNLIRRPFGSQCRELNKLLNNIIEEYENEKAKKTKETKALASVNS